MHNLHLVVIHGKSGADACKNAENMLSDFGNENNWREFSGAISEHGLVYMSGEGRFSPKPNMTIHDCNLWMRQVLTEITASYGNTALAKLQSGNTDVRDQSKWSKYDLYNLKRLAEHLYEMHGGVKTEDFDVLQHTFYDWRFDQEGVTHCDDYAYGEEGECRWVVFVDMHS